MSALNLSGLGQAKQIVENTLSELLKENVIGRIWQKDHTVWSDDPTEISNRLGWLDCIDTAKKFLPEVNEFVQEIKSEKYKNVLVMGMGGSSLAPEVFSLIFGKDERLLNVYVLDSTHPEAVKNFADKLNHEETLYIVSTKSGGTVETLSFMKFFYNLIRNEYGIEKAGKQFVAITDPGSGLQKIAEELNFRKIFLNDPDIGGRYSALSLFGLVPAALVGVDLEKLLQSSETAVMKSKINEADKIHENNAAILGSLLGALANEGKNKLTLLYSDEIKYFGSWLEQLIAESTGKNGKGIFPVDLEAQTEVENYGMDRIFVYTRLNDDHPYDELVHKLKTAGHHVVEVILNDLYSIGAEYFNWEMATAIAGWKMKLQPFDQPNVESAKVQAKKLVAEYQERGMLQSPKISYEDESITVYGHEESKSIEEALNKLLSKVEKNKSYIAIQGFVNPDEETFEAFNSLRSKLLNKYKVATSFGFGPRFLHSTGQLHKGDDGSGLFLQFIESGSLNLPIPDNADDNDSQITFDVLIRAQALGDREALLENGRHLVTFDIHADLVYQLKQITNLI